MMDIVFRLMAVRRLAGLVERVMPQLIGANTIEPDAGSRILGSVKKLTADSDRQEVHTAGELAEIERRTELLALLLRDRLDRLTQEDQQSFESIMRILTAKPGKEMRDALGQLK